ncbi:hypothetical protein ACWCPQ_07660 [Nocardia sp. NPDC001965]
MSAVSLIEDAGERLISVTTAATRDIRRRTTGIASRGVQGADHLSHIDDRAAGRIRIPGDRPETVTTARNRWPITGTDYDNGRDVEIDPADIVSVPLHDADGRPIGVLFPSQPTDIEDFVPWAQMRNRTSDLSYRLIYERVPASQTGGDPIWAYGGRKEAPWTQEAPWAKEVRRTGIPPLYVISHANPHAFTVQVRTNNSLRTMFLDGESYGESVAVNPHLLRAAEGNDMGVLLPLSCSPSRMYGSIGDLAARHLITDGEMDRNIHMPRSTMFFGRDEDTGESWLGAETLVTEVGRHNPEFDSYWGSPYAFLDRP